MAEDAAAEIIAAVRAAPQRGEMLPVSDLSPRTRSVKRDRKKARRVEAMSLRLAGLSYDQIGARLGITPRTAQKIVREAVQRADTRQADQMRAVEGARLDRAQAAIWTRVLEGDLGAIQAFVQISNRRARMFGLDAPATVSIDVRAEMVSALEELERVIIGEVVESGQDSSES